MIANKPSRWFAIILNIALLPVGQGLTATLPQLLVQRDGGAIQVTWNGGILQTAPSVTGPWNPNPTQTSPLRAVLGQGAQYFRVLQTFAVAVTKTGTGTGLVVSIPEGIQCGPDCSEIWPSGGTITLRATAEPGSTFANWSGDCAGTNDCQLTVNGPVNVTATFNRAAATVNTVVNGDFEQGPLVGWQQQPGQLIFTGAQLGVVPHSGEYLARLGYDQDNRRIVRLGQQIALPTSTPLYLNFALWLYSEELCDVPYYDAITIYVSGQTVVQDDRVCRGSDTGGWRRYSIDLSAVAGQSVPVVFEIYSTDVLTSIMLLDDIALSNQPWQ